MAEPVAPDGRWLLYTAPASAGRGSPGFVEPACADRYWHALQCGAVKTLEDLLERAPERILFAAVVGSQAYGTATAESDVDVHGLFVLPANAYLALSPPAEQLGDERSNVVY